MSRKAAALAFRTKKETEGIKAYRPLHMILFPLNQETGMFISSENIKY